MMIVMTVVTMTMTVLNLSCAMHITFSHTEYIEESIVSVEKATDIEILANLQVLSPMNKQK
jgi:hypothetical protein